MRRHRAVLATVLVLGAVLMQPSPDAVASSHREAPFLTKNPKVDATDFYMFNSYEPARTGFVTLIANYIPLQDPFGGPNYFSLDPEALYEIHVDNNGDAKEDITFQFKFTNALNGGEGLSIDVGAAGAKKKVAVPQYNIGGISGGPGDANALNVNESYTVNVIRGDRRTGAAAQLTNAATGPTFRKPADYVGDKTFGANAYGTYASQFVYGRNATNAVTIPGCSDAGARVFVGQRRDPFAANLGVIFDLVNAPPAVITDITARAALDTTHNNLDQKNVTSIAIEIPTACLLPTGGGPGNGIIGGWTTASVRQARVINPSATYAKPAREGGAWTQVSRLGMPLVNEVVIGLRDKDKFNSSQPKDDAANFIDYVTHPTLPAILETLFGSASVVAPTAFPRSDLVAVFLTGVPGVNLNVNGVAGAEMLRLNTGLPATPYAAQNPLGAAQCFPNDRVGQPTTDRAGDGGTTDVVVAAPGCDPAGFPNGRRPKDDVVDIALTTVMGYFLKKEQAPNSGTIFHDAVSQESVPFDTTFPYLQTPRPGHTPGHRPRT